MITIAQAISFVLAFMIQNPTPTTLQDLIAIQTTVTQDIATLQDNTVAPIQTTNQVQTTQTTSQPVVQGVPQTLSFSVNPTRIQTNATTTITVIANQTGYFSNGGQFNLEGRTPHINALEIGQTSAYNISSDGTQASFDLYVPDGVYTYILPFYGQQVGFISINNIITPVN